MKIGILTLPFNNNYGGYLQAIALSEVLQRLGHNPVVINRRNNKYSFKEKVKIFALGVRGLFNRKKKHPFFAESPSVFYTRGKKMIPFAQKNLVEITTPIYTSQELKSYSDSFEAFIVGSDQVWRPIYVPGIEDYFFKFLGSSRVKRIAYAASFGNTCPEFTREQISECGELVKEFTSISLREESGKDVFAKFGWHFPELSIVLDPTLLLPKEYYMGLLDNVKIQDIGKLFCYVLDGNVVTDELCEIITSNKRLDKFVFLDKKKWEDREYIMPSIENWLNGIINSEFVLTDSYHGAVFSIIFNKPFIVFANKRRGIDRFLTLLKYFKLEDRLVTDCSPELEHILETHIDWARVNTRIIEGRKCSIDFLVKSLN